MTPVQASSIPLFMQHKDVVVEVRELTSPSLGPVRELTRTLRARRQSLAPARRSPSSSPSSRSCSGETARSASARSAPSSSLPPGASLRRVLQGVQELTRNTQRARHPDPRRLPAVPRRPALLRPVRRCVDLDLPSSSADYPAHRSCTPPHRRQLAPGRQEGLLRDGRRHPRRHSWSPRGVPAREQQRRHEQEGQGRPDEEEHGRRRRRHQGTRHSRHGRG